VGGGEIRVIFRKKNLKFALQDDKKNKEFLFTDFHIYIFGPKRDEIRGEWKKNYIMRSLIICTTHPISSGDKI